jgi:Ca-activated chloride channel family protein
MITIALSLPFLWKSAVMSDIIRLDKSGHLSVDGKQLKSPSPSDALAILLIDRSGSMAGPKTTYASSGAWDFSQATIKKGYRIASIEFATGASVTCAPSRSADDVRRGCFANSITGSTAMHEGLQLACSLEPRTGDTIVIVTDGAVDDPKGTLAIGAKLKSSGVEILAIGTDDADKSFLSQLASRPDLSMKVASSNLRLAITDASRLLGSSRR